jgi:RNA polymerase sigma factor (sigma-70 family)
LLSSKLSAETDLIRDISNGLKVADERLKERIYKHYWGYLMGVSLRYIPNRDIAKEVVNDSFMKAFNHMEAFVCDDESNFNKVFKAWLAKIAVRTALNEIRKRKSMFYYEELSDEHEKSYNQNFDDSLNVADIMDLLNKLLPMHKTVFNLYEIEGFNHEEIADILDIPASSSRVYLTRAKEKLRSLYLRSVVK